MQVVTLLLPRGWRKTGLSANRALQHNFEVFGRHPRRPPCRSSSGCSQIVLEFVHIDVERLFRFHLISNTCSKSTMSRLANPVVMERRWGTNRRSGSSSCRNLLRSPHPVRTGSLHILRVQRDPPLHLHWCPPRHNCSAVCH